MGAEYFSGNFADFQYNPYNTLKSYIEYGKGVVSNDSIVKAKEQLAKQQAQPSVFKFSEGKNLDEYQSGALSAAKAFIADGDVKDASGKGDGRLTREEFIALHKLKEEKLKNQTGKVMQEVKIEGENPTDSYGKIFDAINTQKNTDGTPETIDEKEVAAYLSYLDASDDKMDGKIKFDTIPETESDLIGESHTNDKEKDKINEDIRNGHIKNLQAWYSQLFPKSE